VLHPRAARRAVMVRRKAMATPRPLLAAARRGRLVAQATARRAAVGNAS
jgi:hypothetical protein